MEETQKNWVTLWNGQSPHLKNHFQLKTKDVGWGGQVWEVTWKPHVNKGKIITQSEVHAFSMIGF